MRRAISFVPVTLPPLHAPPPPDAATPSPPPSPRALSIVVGLLAAASCIGAILGFGLRAGVPSLGFNAIAVIVLGDAARGVWGWDYRVTPVGIAVLAVTMFVWGVVYVTLARRAAGWQAMAWAVGVGAVAWALAAVAVARRLAGDPLGVLAQGQVVGVHVVLAVTLVVGMRFALGGNADGGRAAIRPGS